ncbi:MAG: fibronectin type III domain-containing protein, partial [bacterium]|nr:fibronectin type III domain-containing protein [bacterium]
MTAPCARGARAEPTDAASDQSRPAARRDLGAGDGLPPERLRLATSGPANGAAPGGLPRLSRISGRARRLAAGLLVLLGISAGLLAGGEARAQTSTDPIWTATLTVAQLTGALGYSHINQKGSLTTRKVEYGGKHVLIDWIYLTGSKLTLGLEFAALNVDHSNSLTGSFTMCFGSTAVAWDGAQFNDKTVSGLSWSVGDMVDLSAYVGTQSCSGGTATLAASDVTAVSATLTIGGHSGQWWYKRTLPTPAGTCTAVAAGTSTASLTDLTASTAYTYKAYSDSACTEANELVSATFTTTAAADPVWTATMTVGVFSGGHRTGYRSHATNEEGSLVRDTLSLDGATYTVTKLNYITSNPSSTEFRVTGSPGVATDFKLCLDGTAAGTDTYLKATDDEPFTATGLNWEAGQTVKVALVGASGTCPAGTGTRQPAVTAGSVTPAGATLTVSNHPATWHHKRTSPTDGTCSAGQTGKTATLGGLSPGTAYTWKTWSDSGCTTELAEVSFTTPPAQVENLMVTAPAEALALSWDAATGATGYEVQWKSGSDSFSSIAVPARHATVTGTSHTISGLIAGRSYTVRVRATKAGAPDGAWSEETAGTPAAGPAIWTAKLTVAQGEGFLGYATAAGSLSKRRITHDGKTLEISAIKLAGSSLSLGRTVPTSFNGLASFLTGTFTMCFGSTAVEWGGGAFTKTVSGLSWSAGDMVDLSAYAGIVSCSGGTVTPSTPSVTAGSVTSAGATLTVSHHPATWHHKRTSPTDGTCSAVTGTATTLSGLSPGTAYSWATYSDASCTTANELASVDFTTAPARVSNLEVTAAKAALALSWDAATGATGYEVQWKSGSESFSSSADPARHATVTDTSYTIAGLEAWREYTVRVRATGAGGDGPWSGEATLAASGLDKVTGVTVSAASAGNALDVGWTAVTGAARYVVTWRTAEQDFADAPSATATGTSRTVTGLTAGTEYMVVVQAADAEGRTGPRSDEAKGTPTAPAVALAASEITNFGARLQLSGHTGAWSHRQTSPAKGACVNVNVGESGTALTHIGNLEQVTEYEYTAYSGSGCTGTTLATATFTTRKLSVSSPVGTTSTTLTVGNHPSTWHHRQLVPAEGSCSAALTGTTASLSGLAPGTTYRWGTFPDSTCALADHLALLQFTTDTSTTVSLAAIAVAGESAHLHLSAHAGAWSYRQTSPATGACSDVGAGTPDVYPDGLTDGTTYGYTAYSGSGCTGTTLATATFTTSQVSVSDPVGTTSTTLTVENHPSTWYHRQLAPAEGSCSTAQTGTTASLSGLAPGTTYRWGTFDGPHCRTGSRLATVDFTTDTPPALSADGVTQDGATLTLANHAGAWWHRRTMPTDGTRNCVGVGANTATAALTGLAAGTAYEWKAYSDSGCATELATATFSTPKVSVSDPVGETSTTLTVTNHPSPWHHRRTAPSAGTCTAVSSGATASLPDLTAGTDYTWKTYSDSSCTAANELAEVRFTTDTPANQAATGAPTVTGTAQAGLQLAADAGDIADGNGLTDPTYAWQWIRVDGSTETDIPGATGATYTATDADAG